MGRRGRRFRLKSAKIWLVLFIFAGLYHARKFFGVDDEVSFSDQLNQLSSGVIRVALVLLGLAIIFFLIQTYRRIKARFSVKGRVREGKAGRELT